MRGFTLAELLVAVALAAVVVLTLVALSITALSGNQKAGDLSIGQSLAHERLEQLIYAAQEDSGLNFWNSNSDSQAYQVEPLQSGNQQFRAALYVSDVTDAAVPNLKRCRMRVSWWGGDQSHAGYGNLYTDVVRFAAKP